MLLHELALAVARDDYERRYEAIYVQDGDKAPPTEWRKELAQRRRKFMKREKALRLGGSVDRDWAAGVVARRMARDRAKAATNEIRRALHAAIMEPGAKVVATSDSGERRQLDRAELTDAVIDFVGNRLEIRGHWWIDVEVAASQATSQLPEIGDVEPDVEMAAALPGQSCFDVELKRRIDLGLGGANGYRDDMLQWAKGEGKSPDEAKALWESRYNNSHRVGRYKRQRPKTARKSGIRTT
jgi:hypothetical protein